MEYPKKEKGHVYIAYIGNEWLNWSSLHLLGIFTTPKKAIIAIKRHYYKTNKIRMSNGIIEELIRGKQTQGLEYNYMYESQQLNKLQL